MDWHTRIRTKSKTGLGTYPVIDNKRLCCKCKIVKHINEFPRDKSKVFGIKPRCSKCVNDFIFDYYHGRGMGKRKSVLNKNKRANDVEWAKNEKEKRKEWYRKNPSKGKEMRIKAQFGIDLNKFHELCANQNNKCAICKSELTGKRKAAIDHDHKTMEIRGILCSNCNTGLGQFKDNDNLLKEAINYLSNYPQSDKEKIYKVTTAKINPINN